MAAEKQKHCAKSNVQTASWKSYKFAFVLYAVVFFVCTLSKGVQSMILYVHMVNFPFWLTDTAYHGLPDARNIEVTLPDGSVIRGWHLLPAGEIAQHSAFLADPLRREEYFDTSLRQAASIVLSLHGNAGNRGTRDRVAEDRMLASQSATGNCHVIAIDYRGFGDSTGWPTHWPSEESTAEDALALWSWLERRLMPPLDRVQEGGKDEGTRECEAGSEGGDQARPPSVFIYGHSLGCAISTQLARHLGGRSKGLQPAGVVLVSPFLSVPDVARDYPYTAFLRLVPYATEFIARFLHFSYSNIEAITAITCPILVIHGTDDAVIPVDHGKQLAETYAASVVSDRSSWSCIRTVRSVAAGDPFNSSEHECHRKSPSSSLQETRRYISFVEASAGHNWVFTSTEWMGTVPAFINRFTA